MNRDRMERWILLRQSGELDALRCLLLARRLSKDEALRDFAASLDRIARDARASSESSAPEPSVMQAILREARVAADGRTAEREEGQASASPWARPAFAAAAVALAIAGAWLLMPRTPPAQTAERSRPAEESLSSYAWDDDLDATIAELDRSLEDEESLAEELLELEAQSI